MKTIVDRFGQRRMEPDDYELEDGESIRVPMTAMDAVQRSVALSGIGNHLHDGLGGPVGHRPGVVAGGMTDAQRKAIDDAYFDYCTRIGNAWTQNRHQLPSEQQQPQRQQPPSGSASMSDADAAYAEYCERISNAWKNGRAA